MCVEAQQGVAPSSTRQLGRQLRVAFVGRLSWLHGCAPSPTHSLAPALIPVEGKAAAKHVAGALERLRPDVTVILDPLQLVSKLPDRLPGRTLGVLVEGLADTGGERIDHLNRIISFDPALTGAKLGRARVWRAIPPPVSDVLFMDGRALHGRPRVMSIGRSTPHREAMLLPSKHHHDLLQLIHGISGHELAAFLRECDVGVYVPAESGGGFGLQVGIHLAAGHLLLSDPLVPSHGLERDIDYLRSGTPTDLAWLLDRLGRFPEMYRSVRVRGRLKAERFRASSVFTRVLHDFLADVDTFGPVCGDAA